MLITVGRIFFDFLWNGLCFVDPEDLSGWRMTVGVIFHGVSSLVWVASSWALDANARLVGGSGEGDRPRAARSEASEEASSSSISSKGRCKKLVSCKVTPETFIPIPFYSWDVWRRSGASNSVRKGENIGKVLSPRSAVQFQLDAHHIVLLSRLFRSPWQTIA